MELRLRVYAIWLGDYGAPGKDHDDQSIMRWVMTGDDRWWRDMYKMKNASKHILEQTIQIMRHEKGKNERQEQIFSNLAIDRQRRKSFNDGQECVGKTLASRGLEELFLQLCCCVSFLFWREIGFGFTYYLCT